MAMVPVTRRCESFHGGLPPFSGKAIILPVTGARSSCFSSATQTVEQVMRGLEERFRCGAIADSAGSMSVLQAWGPAYHRQASVLRLHLRRRQGSGRGASLRRAHQAPSPRRQRGWRPTSVIRPCNLAR